MVPTENIITSPAVKLRSLNRIGRISGRLAHTTCTRNR